MSPQEQNQYKEHCFLQAKYLSWFVNNIVTERPAREMAVHFRFKALILILMLELFVVLVLFFVGKL